VIYILRSFNTNWMLSSSLSDSCWIKNYSFNCGKNRHIRMKNLCDILTLRIGQKRSVSSSFGKCWTSISHVRTIIEPRVWYHPRQRKSWRPQRRLGHMAGWALLSPPPWHPGGRLWAPLCHSTDHTYNTQNGESESGGKQ